MNAIEYCLGIGTVCCALFVSSYNMLFIEKQQITMSRLKNDISNLETIDERLSSVGSNAAPKCSTYVFDDNVNDFIDFSEKLQGYKYEIKEIDYTNDIGELNKLVEEDEKRRVATTATPKTAVVKPSTFEQMTTAPNENILNEIATRGNFGRLYIPDLGINVALFNSSFHDYGNQVIVDNKDSAAWLGDNYIPVVADHKHQGFNGLYNAVAYQTYAYINYGDHLDTYLCIDHINGHNTGSAIVDEDGNNMAIVQDKYGQQPYVVMYTCNDNWKNVTITVWVKQ